VFEVPAQAQLQKDKEWLVVVCFVVASSTRRRLDAVDADMLPVLWLPGPASAEKGSRRRPGSGVLHTDVGDLVSRVERLQQHKFKTCT